MLNVTLRGSDWFPARSTQVADAVWSRPSVVTDANTFSLATPDPPPAHPKIATTSVLHHPDAGGVGELPTNSMVGACVSVTVTISAAEPLLPALSVAAQVIVVTPTGKVSPLCTTAPPVV